MLNRPEEEEPRGQNAVKLLCGMGMVLQLCRVEATVASGVRRMGKVGEAEPRRSSGAQWVVEGLGGATGSMWEVYPAQGSSGELNEEIRNPAGEWRPW